MHVGIRGWLRSLFLSAQLTKRLNNTDICKVTLSGGLADRTHISWWQLGLKGPLLGSQRGRFKGVLGLYRGS
jgi:hypothetical protein